MKMRNYTKIPNELFEESQLSIVERYLFGLLLKYCGKKDYCYPSQKTIAKIMGYSERYVRVLLKKLEEKKIIYTSRTGFNRPNTYKVSKDLIRNSSSPAKKTINEIHKSPHLGTAVPLHIGKELPPNSTYIKEKDKNKDKNLAALEKCRLDLIRKGVLKEKEVVSKGL
jgi:DNA-binding transcriptional regulator GbsR (MarR family)